jgi:hypothetical protein
MAACGFYLRQAWLRAENKLKRRFTWRDQDLDPEDRIAVFFAV